MPSRPARVPTGHKRCSTDPVDLVAAGILGVAGAAARTRLEPARVPARFPATSIRSTSPLVELVALYKRRKMEERVEEGKRSAFENWIDTFLEPYPASKELYFAPARRSSAPPPRIAES